MRILLDEVVGNAGTQANRGLAIAEGIISDPNAGIEMAVLRVDA